MMNDSSKKREKHSELEGIKMRTKYELMYEAFYISNLCYLMSQSTENSKDKFSPEHFKEGYFN